MTVNIITILSEQDALNFLARPNPRIVNKREDLSLRIVRTYADYAKWRKCFFTAKDSTNLII